MAWEELFFRVPCLRRIPPTWSCHGSRLSGDPVSHHNNANKESLPMPCAKHICTHNLFFLLIFTFQIGLQIINFHMGNVGNTIL